MCQVEFESPAHGNPEVDLLPVAALALDHRLEEHYPSAIQLMTRNRMEDDSESECGDLVGQLALPGLSLTSKPLSLVFHLSQNRQNLMFISALKTGVGDSSGEEDSLDLEP